MREEASFTLRLKDGSLQARILQTLPRETDSALH